MNVRIEQGKAYGSIDAPPSKSMAHRLLICAGLSNEESIIHGISLSEDIRATLGCLEALGADCTYQNGTIKIVGTDLSISGELNLNCTESGSTLRFFIPICLLTGQKATFSGTKRLLSRPLDVYKKICDEQDILYHHTEDSLTVDGTLKSGNFVIPGNISSQFISGMLFALPLLKNDSILQILPPVESRSYIHLTLSALNEFGIKIQWQDENTLMIKGGQSYSGRETTVEGDCSNAAFLEALNILGGNVKVHGLNQNSLQGDYVYKKLFQDIALGCPQLDLSNCPDLAPILFTLASARNGAVFTGTKRLKIKESDRGTVMAKELSKLGADIKVYEDRVVVNRAKLHKPDCILCGHNDHRVVMSLSVLLTLFGGEIAGAEAVKKSFPDFFEKLKTLKLKVKLYENG